MTTITVRASGGEMTIDGHAGSREVCISIAGATQAFSEILRSLNALQREQKYAGHHRLGYDANATTLAIENGMMTHFAAIAEMFPENVAVAYAS